MRLPLVFVDHDDPVGRPTGLTLLVLRCTRPEDQRPVRVPGYPLAPILFVLGEMAVVVGAYSDPAVRGAAHIAVAWVMGAAICYALLFRNVEAA